MEGQEMFRMMSMAALAAGALVILPSVASAVCQESDLVLLDYGDRYELMFEVTTAGSKNQDKGLKRVNKDCQTALKDNDKCASREAARQQQEKNFPCNEIDDKSGKKSCKKDNKNEKKAQQDIIKAERKFNQELCDAAQICVEFGNGVCDLVEGDPDEICSECDDEDEFLICAAKVEACNTDFDDFLRAACLADVDQKTCGGPKPKL
jgi:hypothetical protein